MLCVNYLNIQLSKRRKALPQFDHIARCFSEAYRNMPIKMSMNYLRYEPPGSFTTDVAANYENHCVLRGGG